MEGAISLNSAGNIVERDLFQNGIGIALQIDGSFCFYPEIGKRYPFDPPQGDGSFAPDANRITAAFYIKVMKGNITYVHTAGTIFP